MEPIRILIVPPSAPSYPAEIHPNLAEMQRIVGGDIEVLYPFDDPVGIICNESGKLEGLPLNRPLRDDSGEIYDIIAGTFFVAELGVEDFTSLSDAMLTKYASIFRLPEIFVRVGGSIHAISYDPEVKSHV